MGFFGDLLNYEQFHLGNMFGKLKDDPERAFIGAFDPFSSAAWGKVTGKDYSPIVDQWGGSTADDFAKAKAEGINTGPGQTMDGVAHAIASVYAGGYGADKMGGLLGNAGNAGSAGTTAADMFKAQEAGLGSSSYGWGGAQTGTQGTLNSVFGADAGSNVGWLLGDGMGAYDKYSKPINAGLDAYGKAQQMMPQQQPIQGGLLQTPPATGPQVLQQLAGQNQQLSQQRQQEDMAQREKRRQMIARMRGY